MHSVVLGLGSNIGHKLSYLRQATVLITLKIGEIQKNSPIYQTKALLPENAPKIWDVDYYNLAILLKTDLTPEELLAEIKQIESLLGRDPKHAFWSPREIDIDILCYDTLSYQSEKLVIPHSRLLERNFALQPLLDVCPYWQHPTCAQSLHKLIKTMPTLTMAPFSISGSKIMAIVNLSEDSFSQENIISVDKFEEHIVELVHQGAEMIDLGAESTKPRVKPKTSDEYWQILQPYLMVMEKLAVSASLPIDLKISIDTYHAKVVDKALNYRCVTMINDIYGIESERIAQLLKQKPIEYVFMHQLGAPGEAYLTIDHDPMLEIVHFAKNKINKLLALGMSKDQLVFDIGVGFGKYPYQVQFLLKNIAEIQQSLGVKLLVGHSRKMSVMPYVSKMDKEFKDIATAMISRDLIRQNIDYVRVHNVELTAIAKFT